MCAPVFQQRNDLNRVWSWNLLFCCMHFGIFKVTESGSQIKKIKNSKMNVQQITCILKTVNSDLELKLA